VTKGLFITLEGPEGAGKTTIIDMLLTYYQEQEKQIIKTREPGGIPISEKIRRIILDPKHTEMDARTEAYQLSIMVRLFYVIVLLIALWLIKVMLEELIWMKFGRSINLLSVM